MRRLLSLSFPRRKPNNPSRGSLRLHLDLGLLAKTKTQGRADRSQGSRGLLCPVHTTSACNRVPVDSMPQGRGHGDGLSELITVDITCLRPKTELLLLSESNRDCVSALSGLPSAPGQIHSGRSGADMKTILFSEIQTLGLYLFYEHMQH